MVQVVSRISIIWNNSVEDYCGGAARRATVYGGLIVGY